MRLIAASTLDDYRRSGAYLIDLRTKEEYEQGHIEGAVNIPYDFLEDYKKRLPRNSLQFCVFIFVSQTFFLQHLSYNSYILLKRRYACSPPFTESTS